MVSKGEHIPLGAEGLPNIDLAMDNFRRELQSHTGAAGAKTSLAVCLAELKYSN
jgi:hypothetical protein